VNDFANWLAGTELSLVIQTHSWVIPTVQSVHIVCIGIVLASVLMIDLWIFGWAGRDQTLTQTTRRFSPWLWTALVILLVTGALMVIGEPVRELMSFSFWLKMTLIVVGIVIATLFQFTLRRNGHHWEEERIHLWTTKSMAILTLLVWCSIVVLGRLIAYDHVWGTWSLRPII
jgi:putative copper export protein